MKVNLIVFCGLVLVGCSHFQHDVSKSVQFPYASDLLFKVQKKSYRRISSLSPEDISEKSPRRVYFSALYHQYLTLGHHLRKNAQIKFCPQFHHDKIETDERLVPNVLCISPKVSRVEGRIIFLNWPLTKSFL
jgi:hypothetical protein